MAVPNRLIMVTTVDVARAHKAAVQAVYMARRLAPKLTGKSSKNFVPIWGKNYFGIGWKDDYVWYQAMGIRAFTMYALAGRTVPMWIDDPSGTERRKNPNAKTRVTASGKTQVLIFRRAAQMGARKTVIRNGIKMSVPESYPGAPGRIGTREAASPDTRPGRTGGQIASGNVGVRWRHPGLATSSFSHRGWMTSFLHRGIADAATSFNIPIGQMKVYTGTRAA